MKTAGWIILIIGILAFFGAALKGNSVFGPCFWITLGGYLLYRANNKEEKEVAEEKPKSSTSTTQAPIKDTPKVKESPKQVVVKQLHEEKEPETIGEIQSQMTLKQR